MKKSLLFGSLGVLTIGTVLMCSSIEPADGAYHERTSSFHEISTANHYMEELYRMNGDFDAEDWHRAWQEMKGMDRSNLMWFDQGPDNVGGRTRAIVIDRNDVNHVWAGSVSGGLFESTTRGGYWKKVDTYDAAIGSEHEQGISSMCQTIDGILYVATNHQREGGVGSEGSGTQSGSSLYRQLTDGTWETVPGITTSSWSYINEIRADTVSNMVWIACSNGLYKYDPVSETADEKASSGGVSAFDITGDGQLIVCAGSGNKTLVSVDGGENFDDKSGTGAGQVVSGGVGRAEYSISKEPGADGFHRIYASFATSGSVLKGIWRSADDGQTWEEIAPENNGDPGSFAPFSNGGGGQGLYDNIITGVPGSPDRLIMGGINCYSWASTGNWTQITESNLHPTNPQYVHADVHEMVWDQLGRLYVGSDGGVSFSDDAKNSSEPSFTHANRGYNVTQFYHMSFTGKGDVIGGAQDNGTTANYHEGTTWQEHKDVFHSDGFGCEMSFINEKISFATVYFSEIARSNDKGENMTGFSPQAYADEFGCDFGVAGLISGSTCGQFNTRIQLWEDPDDENSEDTITFIPSQGYLADDTVQVPSATSQTFIDYVTTTDITYDDTLYYDPAENTSDIIIKTEDPGGVVYNLTVINWSFVFGAPTVDLGDTLYLIDLDTNVVVDSLGSLTHYWGTNPAEPGELVDMGNDTVVFSVAWDTLMVADPFQSWFVLGVGSGQGVWMTRNALRFSSNPEWIKAIDDPAMGLVSCLEFSKDGEHLFIGTYDGQLWRLDGFNSVYSPVWHDPSIVGFEGDSLIDWDRGHYATTLTKIDGSIGGGAILGIGPGALGDPDHLVVATGGSTGGVYETNNATGASPSWSEFTALSNMPYYSCVIDRDDPNVILAGSIMGVFSSTDGGSTWENSSGKFGAVPVYDMGQNWRTFDEGSVKPGTIYIGTHGRGIWSTDEYLNLDPGTDNLETAKFVPNIIVYPNPMEDNGAIRFDLDTDSDVTVQIFNLQGQVVREINQKGMSSGTNNLTFGTYGLPGGTYIVRLTAGELVETAKFIKH